MAFKSKSIADVLDFNELAGKKWECPVKGLKKTVISFIFYSMKKATEISKCLIEVSNVKTLGDRESNHLNRSNENEFWIELGTSLTPIDRYIEIFVQNMLIGEKSQCCIKTTSRNIVQFEVHLKNIDLVNYIYRLNAKEMYDLALKFKENGVAMFKKYPKFAEEYFCRAAKCLMSFTPFNDLTKKVDGVNPQQMNDLLRTIQLNIAACFIKEKQRYEDVIYLTQFVDNFGSGESGNLIISDKAIYRRAVAFYNLKTYAQAKATLEKCDYKGKKEFFNLYNRILNDWKIEANKYNNMIKKMFG